MDLDRKRVEKLGSKIFQLLFEQESSEAEAVAALCLGATMRLAYECNTPEELERKVEKLSELFKLYAKENHQALVNAMNSKDHLDA